MIIGIVGTRSRDTYEDQYRVFEALHELLYKLGYTADMPFTLVSGGCPKGGDRFAQVYAQADGLPVVVLDEGASCVTGAMNIHPALWDKHGKSAGFVRNTYIARDADYLIACVAPNRKGGTEDTIKKFSAKWSEEELKNRLILV